MNMGDDGRFCIPIFPPVGWSDNNVIRSSRGWLYSNVLFFLWVAKAYSTRLKQKFFALFIVSFSSLLVFFFLFSCSGIPITFMLILFLFSKERRRKQHSNGTNDNNKIEAHTYIYLYDRTTTSGRYSSI